MQNQFTMTDRKVERPTCVQITVERLNDSDPDLSWLDQSDEEMGDGFEETARERKASYGSDWEMIGIRATASFLVPMGPVSVAQELTSPGLWSIESDSSTEHLQSVEDEQINDLRLIMDALGIDHTDADVRR